ncbi:MAG: ABC transporter permease [Pseudomonadota bacterium]
MLYYFNKNGLYMIQVITISIRQFLLSRHYMALLMLGPIVETLLIVTVFAVSVRVLTPQTGDDLLRFILPALWLASILQRSFEVSAYNLMDDKLTREIENFLMAPLSTGKILIGWVGFALINGFIVGLLLWVFLIPFEWIIPVDMGLALLWMILGVVFCALCGILSSIYSSSWDSISLKVSFIFIPGLYLSGVFYSIERLPDVFADLMEWNPFYLLINGFRDAVRGHSLEYHDMLIMIGYVICIALLCNISFKKLKQ